jgi:hypothetical protein
MEGCLATGQGPKSRGILPVQLDRAFGEVNQRRACASRRPIRVGAANCDRPTAADPMSRTNRDGAQAPDTPRHAASAAARSSPTANGAGGGNANDPTAPPDRTTCDGPTRPIPHRRIEATKSTVSVSDAEPCRNMATCRHIKVPGLRTNLALKTKTRRLPAGFSCPSEDIPILGRIRSSAGSEAGRPGRRCRRRS